MQSRPFCNIHLGLALDFKNDRGAAERPHAVTWWFSNGQGKRVQRISGYEVVTLGRKVSFDMRNTILQSAVYERTVHDGSTVFDKNDAEAAGWLRIKINLTAPGQRSVVR